MPRGWSTATSSRPTSCWRTAIERVKLTDFGLARAAADASMTQSGVIAGTPHYMAPEQARGEATDHRADLFSLGSTLYAMCTGHPPFRAESPLAVLRRVSDDEPRPLRQINPEIPEWLEAIVDPAPFQGPGPAVFLRIRAGPTPEWLPRLCSVAARCPVAFRAGPARDADAPVVSGGRGPLCWDSPRSWEEPCSSGRVARRGLARRTKPAKKPSTSHRWLDPRRTLRMKSINRLGTPGIRPIRSRSTSIGEPTPMATIRYPHSSAAWPIELGPSSERSSPAATRPPMSRPISLFRNPTTGDDR